MPYPQAPWNLQGYAIATAHLIDVDLVRPLVPPELEIISVWSGKTVGCLYLAKYETGSVLQYNELIVAPALVKYGSDWGAWISHIYVDNPDSVAGGQEIWYLPKQLAEFTWEQGDLTHTSGSHSQPQRTSRRCRVSVQRENALLCQLSYSLPTWQWRLPLSGHSFSASDLNLFVFPATFNGLLGIVDSKLEVPPESDFAQLNLKNPVLATYIDRLQLKVDAPRSLQTRNVEFSYR